MSTPFQNRLVGTVIVAAVLIIFLPDVLDGNKEQYHAEFEPIPKAPKPLIKGEKVFPTQKTTILYEETEVEEIAVDDMQAEPQNNEITSGNSLSTEKVKVDPLPQQKNINSPSASHLKTKTDNRLPEKAVAQTAWVVQLGSFRHAKNVDELVDKLKASGYTVFTKPIKTKKGTLTKVCVGPELIKSKLEEKLPHLKTLTGMQGKLARFTPSK